MNIKEIEQRSGLTRANIRYYEQEGLLRPARQENKYRDYSEEDLETLLRIALLRSLGFSIDEIRRLQSGELALSEAMRSRSDALGAEGQRLLAAQSVCETISREVTSYSALQPEQYLSALSGERKTPSEDVLETHSWRRFFARSIDTALCGLPVSFLLYVVLRTVVEDSTLTSFLTGLAGWVVMLLLEPLLLARFGTTPGKRIMGITLTRPDGEKLSYREGLERTALVFVYGEAMTIPLVQLLLNFLSYRKYTKGEVLAWENGSVEHFSARSDVRMVLGYVGNGALCFALSLVMLLSTLLPPCRGELTVAEFAENMNYYRERFDLSERWRMDESGQWVENRQDNVIYFGTSPGQPEFTYEVENGVLRAVRWDYAVHSDETVTLPLGELQMAAYALGAAGKDVNLFTAYPFGQLATSEDWAADESFNQSKYGTVIDYRAQVTGDYFTHGGILFTRDGGRPLDVDVSFEVSVEQKRP